MVFEILELRNCVAKMSSGDMDNIFPKYRFFPINGGADVEYTGPVTADAMTLYLKKVGQPGLLASSVNEQNHKPKTNGGGEDLFRPQGHHPGVRQVGGRLRESGRQEGRGPEDARLNRIEIRKAR